MNSGVGDPEREAQTKRTVCQQSTSGIVESSCRSHLAHKRLEAQPHKCFTSTESMSSPPQTDWPLIRLLQPGMSK